MAGEKMKRLVSSVSLLALALAAFCADRISVQDLGSYFQGCDGCFVLYDVGAGSYTVFNKDKAFERAAPCSSFKVVNSLIGLETKVVADENTVFRWDGTRYPLAAWNRDLSLAEAISLSAYWCYQRIARSVGSSRMQGFLDSLDFGNKDISGGIDQFWQQSSLKISPKEWVDILSKIRSYNVPFSRRSVDILRKIIRLGEGGGATLYGKTGSGTASPGFDHLADSKIVSGWFVGFVERGREAYCFATHINAASEATGVKAREITLKLLRDRGIF
jgi:beta-lactamase class D